MLNFSKSMPMNDNGCVEIPKEVRDAIGVQSGDEIFFIEFVNLKSLLDVIPFDLEQSDLAAYSYARRSAYQLSLCDCACLALAEARGVEILTAERAWAKLPDLPIKIKLIR